MKRPSGFALLWMFVLTALQGCRAEPEPWPLWQAYTQHFLDDQGRVIDRTAGDRTTSEGQAYAMFFALVDNDRARFDKLLHWTEANLAQGDLTARLPAWDWGRRRAASGRCAMTIPRRTPTCGWPMTCWRLDGCGKTLATRAWAS